MKYIYLGKITNTHGIKGEIKIISDFELKAEVFKKGFKIYIGDMYEEHLINTYRVHKNYDMITLDNINDINDVLKYKGNSVYINENDLANPNKLNNKLIDLEIVDKNTNKKLGKVINIIKNKNQDILLVKYNNIEYMIPKVDAFIKKIDFDKKLIYINYIEGLIDEN